MGAEGNYQPSIVITADVLVKELGLSPTAISQIINGKGRYSEATRKRVLDRVRELGYTPHAGARAARLKRFETFALFNAAPFWQGIPHPGIYEGCMEGCADVGYRLILESVTDKGMPGLRDRSNLLGQRVCDGLLMNYHMQPPDDLRRLVNACGIPVVWLNVQLSENSLYPDDEGATSTLAQALIAKGRRRIAYVDTSPHHDYQTPDGLRGAHYSVSMRMESLRTCLEQAGLPLVRLTPGLKDFDERMAAARAFLKKPDRPDGLICYNEQDAQIIVLAAAELGLTLGKDLGVAQYSEHPDILKRPIATALIPFRDMAKAAITDLVAAVASGERSLPSRAIPYTFALESTL
jgi:LacI family transcriptional regulator